MLINELYAGRIVWNKVRMIKDPATGKRVPRPNRKDQYRSVDAPHLAIVEDATFKAAQVIKAGRSHQGASQSRKAVRPSASNRVLQSMDLPSRSRANHAVRYVCPEWTWPADELIHIREMSERTSVPASSLRYYEKLGLITSERETSGSQRRYSKSTFYKIILITLAQSAGFNLDEIAEQLRNLPDIHPLPPKVWGPLHKIWERRIDQRVAELKQLKIILRRCTRDASR